MDNLFCSWCSGPLQKAADRPTLCVHCFAAAAEIKKEWFACDGKPEVKPEPAKKKIRTTPDCSCGGETFDAGSNWRCFECGRESPKATGPICLWFEVGEKTSHTWEHLSDALPGLLIPLEVVGIVVKPPIGIKIKDLQEIYFGSNLAPRSEDEPSSGIRFVLSVNDQEYFRAPICMIPQEVAVDAFSSFGVNRLMIAPEYKVRLAIEGPPEILKKSRGIMIALLLGYEK